MVDLEPILTLPRPKRVVGQRSPARFIYNYHHSQLYYSINHNLTVIHPKARVAYSPPTPSPHVKSPPSLFLSFIFFFFLVSYSFFFLLFVSFFCLNN
ncbi:hypothetical protein GDO78_018582 [Eleutherodactylus coqui]|uniref:Uncharacterized protein n=1 Tax=Eleutherodactylus coqui TaxID=57060 RepID=A0A8J6BDL5_ELECQ|nr:hypothetical protein GDO78_018582 [Eleutherodactylus coqui]